MSQFSDNDYQWAARCSAIEICLEVIAGAALANDPQAEGVIAHLKEILSQPVQIKGNPDSPERAQQFAGDVQEFGLHLAEKIEWRYRALTAE